MSLRLYCGGQFNFDYQNSDYFDKVKYDYRAILLGSADKLLQKSKSIKVSGNINYIGPFYFESVGMIDKDIVGIETKMIGDCTNAIFLLDNGCCPGTISELILASTLGKHIAIFYIRKSNDEETESTLHTPCWFPIIMSQLINKNVQIIECKNYIVACQKILEYVRYME